MPQLAKLFGDYPENPKNKRVVRLDQFPVASAQINELMPKLREAFLASDELRRVNDELRRHAHEALGSSDPAVAQLFRMT